MYRTPKTHELILRGVPDKFRGETWILFSGAINEVRSYLVCPWFLLIVFNHSMKKVTRTLNHKVAIIGYYQSDK